MPAYIQGAPEFGNLFGARIDTTRTRPERRAPIGFGTGRGYVDRRRWSNVRRRAAAVPAVFDVVRPAWSRRAGFPIKRLVRTMSGSGVSPSAAPLDRCRGAERGTGAPARCLR